MHARDEDKVVAGDEDKSQHESRSSAAAPRTHSYGHAEQREDQARRGKREAPLKFRSSCKFIGTGDGEERESVLFGVGER